MPPVGQKRHRRRARQRLQRRDPARGLGREEFEPVEAEIEPAHDVAGSGDAGQIGNAALDDRLAKRFGQARRDDELGCRRPSPRSSCRSFSTVPAPTIAPGTFAICADRVERDAACAASPRAPAGPPATSVSASAAPVASPLEHQHRDDRRGAHDRRRSVHRRAPWQRRRRRRTGPAAGWVISLTGMSSILRSKRPLAMKRSRKPERGR